MNSIHISGPLTNIHDRKMFIHIYENLIELCNAYVPKVFSPIKDTDFTPTSNTDTAYVLWKQGCDEVSSANVVLAYVGQPSLGVGAELEIARVSGAHIILWWFIGESVSRMAVGNPSVISCIEARDENDLYAKLNLYLKNRKEHGKI